MKERDTMVALLDREKPDETALLKQLDRMSDREKEIKQTDELTGKRLN